MFKFNFSVTEDGNAQASPSVGDVVLSAHAPSAALGSERPEILPMPSDLLDCVRVIGSLYQKNTNMKEKAEKRENLHKQKHSVPLLNRLR